MGGGRVGERQWRLAWLERGLTVLATDEGERAQFAVEHADATQQDDPVRALAAFEAARSVFERLNDVRSIAVTMDQIADILQQRGDTAEALRIQLEEVLPAAGWSRAMRSKSMMNWPRVLSFRKSCRASTALHLLARCWARCWPGQAIRRKRSMYSSNPLQPSIPWA